jgi:hypothetical protein
MREFLEGTLDGTRISRQWIRHVAIAVFCSLTVAAASARAQTVPANPQPTCTVPAPTFATWFQSGSVTLNGVVNPANGVTFSNPANNCAFYQCAAELRRRRWTDLRFTDVL